MVHICSRHSGNMAGAEAERSEVEAEPQRSAAERRHLPCADYSSSRGFLPRSGISRGADLGAALAAERHLPRSGFGRDADTGLGGVRGGVSPPRYGTGELLYLYPIPV